jgi:hypothetical protein
MILLDFFLASGGHPRSFLNEAEGGGRRKMVKAGHFRRKRLISSALRVFVGFGAAVL